MRRQSKTFLLRFPKLDVKSLSSLRDPPQQDDDIFVMSVEEFVIILKKTFNGSAGGPTGSMGEHFRDILHETAVPMALLRLFTLLINGRFPRWTHPYIFVYTQTYRTRSQGSASVCR